MVTTPTALLVHGTFTDASCWSGVITRLNRHSVPVTAPVIPLRGLAADAAYISSVASRIAGPVVLVGHGYGGTVISVAGTAPNVVGLVYVSAYALDEGESPRDLERRFPSSASDPGTAVVRTTASARCPVTATHTEAPPVAAWKTRPSWMMLAGADPVSVPEAVRFCARRAEATLLEVDDAAHGIPRSHPTDVAELIRDAVRATT
ncbi:alpha/beta fold hydrolase [Streptomyces lavenduligriseus]|uniref:Alpha/beta hydrolase n=1 Tax=Streptomyces lavenduligriseus TaxID=67315 RepID=A0ABT0NTV2_9ACTN|nr:alpha/beta hydrolase [Streptomyces lavenduligriseus]MCL3994733.1 alpha/beta hydrolase [Streptomyces lavenduligriseus]